MWLDISLKSPIPIKGYTLVYQNLFMNKNQVRYGIYACIAAMIGAVLYAFVRLYILNQRVDIDIIIVNIVLFTISAGIMVYLSWKQRDTEMKEMFRD